MDWIAARDMASAFEPLICAISVGPRLPKHSDINPSSSLRACLPSPSAECIFIATPIQKFLQHVSPCTLSLLVRHKIATAKHFFLFPALEPSPIVTAARQTREHGSPDIDEQQLQRRNIVSSHAPTSSERRNVVSSTSGPTSTSSRLSSLTSSSFLIPCLTIITIGPTSVRVTKQIGRGASYGPFVTMCSCGAFRAAWQTVRHREPCWGHGDREQSHRCRDQRRRLGPEEVWETRGRWVHDGIGVARCRGTEAEVFVKEPVETDGTITIILALPSRS